MNLVMENHTQQFYQWDTGQYLMVEGAETCEEVHFCHGGEEAALVCPVGEDGRVAVPNVLLQQDGKLWAYLFARKEDGSRTVRSFSFEVMARPKPESYVYTQTEVLDYAYLSQRVENLEGDGLKNAVTEYLERNPVQAGATREEAEQIRINKEDIVTLRKEKLSAAGGTVTGKLVFPTGDPNAGFANSQDMKIFGYDAVDGTMYLRMGDTAYPVQIRGKGDRPRYNDAEIAIKGDIPTDAHINDLIHTALGVIEHGTY